MGFSVFTHNAVVIHWQHAYDNAFVGHLEGDGDNNFTLPSLLFATIHEYSES